MLPNGLIACLDLALGPAGAGASTRAERERYAAMVMGLFREDIVVVPLLGVSMPSPSLGHIWPWSRRRCTALFDEAVAAGRRGEGLRGAFHLGRAAHVLTDMACPNHAQAVCHYLSDPFERYVEAHVAELTGLAVPDSPAALTPRELVDSLAAAARDEKPDGTKSPWGRVMRRLGLRRPPSGREVADQARRLVPLAAAHLRTLLARYEECVKRRD